MTSHFNRIKDKKKTAAKEQNKLKTERQPRFQIVAFSTVAITRAPPVPADPSCCAIHHANQKKDMLIL